MNYETIICNVLDSLEARKSHIGYDYIVSGMLLILEDKTRVNHITKLLYMDIAKQYDTSWKCVEKNIRVVVSLIWESSNKELLEVIFNTSDYRQKPTNKVFFRYLYDYILALHKNTCQSEQNFSFICPISKGYCRALSLFYTTSSDLSDKKSNASRHTDRT